MRANGTIPQHRQLSELLLAEIASGSYVVGDRLPTEEQLCSTHGLSRGTVRRALGRLEQLGMIDRRPGAGTRVIASTPLSEYRPVAQSTQDIATLAAETRVLKPTMGEIILDETLAARVGGELGAVWFRFEGPRYRRSDPGLPLCWSEHYLRGDLPREPLVRGEFTAAEASLYKIVQSISGGLVHSPVAEALSCAPGSPALVITRRSADDAGRLISVGIHTHPADRYSITTTI
jgi:DNA-binding GntR family transcriptional regulator